MNRLKSQDSNGSTSTRKEDHVQNPKCIEEILKFASRDKLRVLSQAMIDMLLNFSLENDFKVFMQR